MFVILCNIIYTLYKTGPVKCLPSSTKGTSILSTTYIKVNTDYLKYHFSFQELGIIGKLVKLNPLLDIAKLFFRSRQVDVAVDVLGHK